MSIEPFSAVSGPAIPMPEANIDTDIIFPARFLLITAREGLGQYAFADRRFAEDGSEIADYALNSDPFRGAKIVIAGANFGCGSSREQAVWAIHGLGIRCVIAASFGEIFESNCVRNGILPITLDPQEIAELMSLAEAGASFDIALDPQTITVGNHAPISFGIAPERKLALANGWDETDLILSQYGDDITAFEAAQETTQPWLYAQATN